MIREDWKQKTINYSLDSRLLALNAIKKFWLPKRIHQKKFKNFIFRFIETVPCTDQKKGKQKHWSQLSINASRNVIPAAAKIMIAKFSKQRPRNVLKIKTINSVVLANNNLLMRKIVKYCLTHLLYVKNLAELKLVSTQDSTKSKNV